MKRCLNMYFAPYKTCNLKCRYCYVPNDHKNETGNDDRRVLAALTELIQKIEDEGCHIGSFCLHGAEPALLSPESLAVVSSKVRDHWNNHKIAKKGIAIQSNGTLFTPEYLKELESRLPAKSDIRLGFSIDPPKAVHDYYRNRSFDLVDANFRHALDRGFPVSILSVVTDDTMKHLEDFKAWMKPRMEDKESHGNPYRVKIKFATGKHRFSHRHMAKFIEFIIQNDFQPLIQILSPGYCLQAGNECEWHEFDIEGNCYSCNKNFKQSGIFASWKTETFDTIVRKREELFSQVIQHRDCQACEFEFICNSGCPTDRYLSGDMAGKAHECDVIKAVIADLVEKGIHITDFYNHNL